LCRLVHGGGPGVIDANLVRQITRPPRGGIEIFPKVRGGIIIIGTPHSPNVGRRALQGTYPTPLQGLGRFRPRGQHWSRPAQRTDFRRPTHRNSTVVLGIHGTSARPALSDTVMRQRGDSWHTTSEAVCKPPPPSPCPSPVFGHETQPLVVPAPGSVSSQSRQGETVHGPSLLAWLNYFNGEPQKTLQKKWLPTMRYKSYLRTRPLA
jgi:hypothetical protein